MRSHHAWRVLPMLLLLLALAVPLSTAMAQDAGSILTVDTPTDGQTAELGSDVIIRGWAGHVAGPGTGVDRVVVLDAPQAAGGVAVAEAVYGAVRADVGQAYGAAMTNSGYTATFRAAGSAGNKTFWVYAHSVANDGWTNKTVTLRYTVAAAPAPAPAPAAVTQPSQSTETYRYRNQQGLYGNTCDNQYGNQYGYGQYNQYGGQYGNQYGGQYGNQYGNQYGSQYCDPYSSQYGSGYGYGSQYGSGLYNQYGYNQYNQYPYNQQYGGIYGAANCATTSSTGFIVSYYNTTNGQYYTTYAQCIAAAGIGGVGNCVLASGYYYNSTTGQYYTTYDQCINPTTGANVVATVGADGTVTLTWTPVSFALQYRVYQVSTGALVATVAQSFGSVSISTTLSGLTPGSTVTYQVRAVGTNNTETAITATWTNTGTAVAAPTNLTVGTRTANTVALTWTPSSTGSISGYQVSCSPTGAAGTFVIVGQACGGSAFTVTGASASGATVGNLTAGTTYYFQVTAFVGSTASVASNTVTTSTL